MRRSFHGFYLFREIRWKETGAQGGSGAQNVDVTQLMGGVDDNSLKDVLETCNHFLVDSEMEIGRHRVYNFARVTLETKYVLEELDVVFDILKMCG